jgi:branched-chain amino acid transport system permease protein
VFSAYTIQIATLAAINAIATLGFYVTLTTGQLSIAQGAFFALGGYIGGWAMIHHGVSLWLALFIALVGGGAASVLTFPATRLRGLYFAVATFAFGSAVAGGIVYIKQFGGPFGLTGIPLQTTFRVTIVTLAIAFIAVQLLDRSPLFLAFSAVRDDPEVAEVLGIKIAHVKRMTIVAGAGLAGVAGVLYASSVGVLNPTDANFDRSLGFLLMAIIGGSRTSWGPLLGAGIWTVAPEVLRFTNDAHWRLILFGALAIFVMSVRPQGLLGRGDFARAYATARRVAAGAKRPTASPHG